MQEGTCRRTARLCFHRLMTEVLRLGLSPDAFYGTGDERPAGAPGELLRPKSTVGGVIGLLVDLVTRRPFSKE